MGDVRGRLNKASVDFYVHLSVRSIQGKASITETLC